MKTRQRSLRLIALLVALALLCAAVPASVLLAYAAEYREYTVEKEASDAQFDFAGNYVAPELTIDGVRDDAYIFVVNGCTQIAEMENAEASSFYDEYVGNGWEGAVSVWAYRGETAIYFFFQVLDTTLESSATSPGDAVTHEDSVEIYLDPLMDGGNNPQMDDIQLNIGLSGYTRKMLGTGSQWGTYSALMDFEIMTFGTLYDRADIASGYTVAIMLPHAPVSANMPKDTPVGIAFANVTRASGDDEWVGLELYDNVQTPGRYYVLDENNNFYWTYEAYRASLTK